MVGIYVDDSTRHPTTHREVGSFVGRWFLSRYPALKNGYLNLGCGENYEEGYCNADFYPFNALRRLMGGKPKRVDWQVDIRYPLKCKDEFFTGIFCEHTFEHVDVWDGHNLLRELHRILRPGGTLRITVPSLEKYVRYYVGETPRPEFEQWKVRGEAIWSLTHAWGHQAVYDAELMTKMLKRAGFSEVTQQTFRSGRDPKLLLDSANRDWETLYMEAVR